MTDRPCVSGTANYTIVIHCGLAEYRYSAEDRRQRKDLLKTVLSVAHKELGQGALAVDVIEIALATIEDSGLFNAGKGSLSNVAGQITLDASIMDGRDRSAGSIANFKTIKNPVRVARAALAAGNRFFVGSDAEKFSKETVHVGPDYFLNFGKHQDYEHKFGTIGAVALDRCGNMAAATSTGGYDYKPVGRVGDSPIIGASTYAENGVCAVSTTGEGEYFIRISAAHEVCAQLKYKNTDVQTAAFDVIENQIGKLNGKGGMIALDSNGNYAWPFRPSGFGMLRGVAQAGAIKISAFDDVETFAPHD